MFRVRSSKEPLVIRRGPKPDAASRRAALRPEVADRENLPAGRANTLGLGVAALLAVATALAQVINYEFFDLRLSALDSNTHMSIFGAVSLLANAVAVGLAISLAVRARNREMVILSGVLAAMFALRVRTRTTSSFSRCR